MRITVFLLALLLAGCSTTSTVYAPHKPAAGQLYVLNYTTPGAEDSVGAAALERAIQSELARAGLLAHPGAETGTVEVTVTHYYMRSNGARFWAGVMAGRDKIISRVRVLDAEGQMVGSYEAESTNATAWGTSNGLHQKHAAEIASRLK
jgi:hypothetical protein